MLLCLPVRIETDRDNRTVPLANLILIAVNLLASIFSGSIDYQSHCPLLFNMIGYSFVHAGTWHLLGNMWILWVFGNGLNRRLGNLWYSCVYLGSALAMGIVLRLSLGLNVVGASGAVFAVVASCYLLLPGAMVYIVCAALFPLSVLVCLFSKPKHRLQWLLRWGEFRIKNFWLILIVPALEIWAILWRGWNWTNLGHLLGLICGVTAVLLLPKSVSMKCGAVRCATLL